jgi:hypothetical protein
MTIMNFQKAEFETSNRGHREGRRQKTGFSMLERSGSPPMAGSILDTSAFAILLRQGYEGTSYGGQANLDARYDIRATISDH